MQNFNVAIPALDIEIVRPMELTALNDLAGFGYDSATYGQAVQLDAAMREAVTQSRCVDATEARSCAEAIARLPGAGETIHLLIGGKHSMGHILPAVLRLAAPETIDRLVLATLTFSKKNAADWAALIIASQVRSLDVICSVYFSKTSPKIYGPALVVLNSAGARVLPVRSHAKIMVAKLSDGRTISAEGSANTRSCNTVEQVTLFGSPGVYDFHMGWTQKLFATAAQGKG